MSASLAASTDEPPIRAPWAWLALILVGAFALRSSHPAFNTAFEDESFMVLMGRSVLARAPDVTIYMRTAFGWYIWPVLAALADRAGGLVGLRMLAGLLGCLATGAMYAFARTLFGVRAGLLAAGLFAVLTPAILTAKIATHDAAAVPLLIAALALYARAWRDGTLGNWIASAMLCFAVFTVKHPLAAVFPALCVGALVVDRRGGLAFGAVLSALMGAYAVVYWDVLLALLAFVQGFNAFRAPDSELIRIYFRERLDLWALVLLFGVGVMAGGRRVRRVAILLVACAVSFAYAHASRRLDYHTWKHAVYPMVFLLPVASVGALRMFDALAQREPRLVVLLGAVAAFTLNLFGRQGLLPDAGGLPFRWPDAQEVVRFATPRLAPNQHVLLDDAAVRYALGDALPQTAMTDAYWFEYGGQRGNDAYAAAIRDGYFDFLVFDGSGGPAARAMRRAIEPELADRYVLRYESDQPSTGELAMVYERVTPPAARLPGAPRLVIEAPRPGGLVVASGAAPRGEIVGRVEPASGPVTIAVDVLTDRWYPQAAGVRAAPDGSFRVPALFAGTGAERCRHLVRVRLIDAQGRILDETDVPDVRRSAPDSLGVSCPES